MRRQVIRIGWLVILGLLLGCGDGQEETWKIAVIPKGLTHEFWKAIHAGALEAARDLKRQGVPVEIDWQGPNKESDREQQIKIVESQISMQTTAIVLAPLDARALVRPVLEAKKQNIPVIIIDSGLETDPENYISFVATDNREGGRKGARRLVELIRARQKQDAQFKPGIILLRYDLGHASTDTRERGFLEVIEQQGLTGALLSSNQYAGATRESAQMKAEALLNQFRGQVNAVFCPNESSTYGVLQALRRTGMAGQVSLVGFDSSPALMAALRTGEISGLVLQDPVRMGYLGVQHAVQVLQGKTVGKRLDTGSWVATPENMNKPDIHSRLAPDLSILD